MKKLLLLTILFIASICFAADVTLTWDKNTEPEVNRYRVFWGNYSGNVKKFPFTNATTVTGPPTTATVSNTGKWYFRVKPLTLENMTAAEYSNHVLTYFVRTTNALKWQKIEVR